MKEKREVRVTLGVSWADVSTGWNRSSITFVDQSGDQARRRVTLKIERPMDIEYIRERLTMIEAAWRKELDTLKVTP